MNSRKILSYAKTAFIGAICLFNSITRFCLNHLRCSLQVASEAYHHVLVKKKDLGVVDPSVKLLPLEALGMVMIFHGEEFPDDSAFGPLLPFPRHSELKVIQEIRLSSSAVPIAKLQPCMKLTPSTCMIHSWHLWKNLLWKSKITRL